MAVSKRSERSKKMDRVTGKGHSTEQRRWQKQAEWEVRKQEKARALKLRQERQRKMRKTRQMTHKTRTRGIFG